MYKLLRSFLFLFDPEKVHYFSMNGLRLLCRIPFMKNGLRARFSPYGQHLQTKFCGLVFKNPVGLGAGFDKNARYLSELETLGFGAVEIGTVTPLPQAGNDKPRLFRLPKDKALINRMGFNNDGADVIRERLKKWKAQRADSRLIIGGNIGKNKGTPNEDAWKDYEACFHKLHPYVDYFVVNVSSPNTPGLRALQEKDSLHKILSNLQLQNKKFTPTRPILLKLAPDLSLEQLDEVIGLATEINLDGLIIANTTISRAGLQTVPAVLEKIGAGGLSGKPLAGRSTFLVNHIREKTNGRLNIIASGGIFTATDAREKMDAGASLVQVWTGFIYEGPAIVKNICKGL
jgi:dihydroorotate dehydrogenase